MGKDFISILKESEPNLASHIEQVQKKGLEDWVHLLVPELGSYAGFLHLRNVERIANRIVPDHLKNDFSAGEIFLLLSAIFLHDIGKTIQPPEEPVTRCGKAPTDCPIKEHNDPPCFKPQWNHFELSEDIIKHQGIALGLPDERIAQYCGLLAFCHCLREPPLKEQSIFTGGKVNNGECTEKWPKRGDYRTTSLAPYGALRIPLLASIIRIADETDNTWTRAVTDYWFQLQKQEPAKVGKAFRRCIEDIEFCHDGQCLILHIPEMMDLDATLQEAYKKSIDKVRNDIATALEHWGQELTQIGVRFDRVYIEHHNHLFTKYPSDSKHQSLCEVVGDKNKKSVEQMLKAMRQLFLGSYEYPQFAWETLEAQVGRPLTSVDKWLARRIADASEHQIVMTDKNEIRIDSTRKKMREIEKLYYPNGGMGTNG